MRLAIAALIAALIFVGQSQVAKAQGTFTITVQITEGTNPGPPLSGVNVQLVMNRKLYLTPKLIETERRLSNIRAATMSHRLNRTTFLILQLRVEPILDPGLSFLLALYLPGQPCNSMVLVIRWERAMAVSP